MIEDIPTPLLEDVKDGNVTPIIGAGFSKNAKGLPRNLNMPDWFELSKLFLKELPKSHKGDSLSPLEIISTFSHLYSRIKLVEYLEKYLQIKCAKPGSSHIEFAQMPFDTIITTNFDFLLEKAFDETNNYYQVILDENQLSMNFPDAKKIVKMHGDLHHPTRLIVTEEDYDSFIVENPIMSTYISNLLISTTPLFIGYSLDDPDFRQLLQVIKNRIGELRRPAYVLKFNATQYDISKFERRGIKVISLSTKTKNYDEILSSLFKEIRENVEKKVPVEGTSTSEEASLNLNLPENIQTMLCFFSIPVKLITYYQTYIFPIVEKFGFQPITTNDIVLDSNIYLKVSGLIRKSSIVIADLSSDLVKHTVYLAETEKKPTIVITEIKEDKVLNKIDNYNKKDILKRPQYPEPPDEEFKKNLESLLEIITKKLKTTIPEPLRLMEKKEYSAGLISAFILLETKLRDVLIKSDIDFEKSRLTFSESLYLANRLQILSLAKETIQDLTNCRNRLVHGHITLESNKSKEYIKLVMNIISQLEKI